jgi:hypothetical protein
MASKRNSRPVSKKAIRRAVASSTAIETGQRIQDVEQTLRGGKSRFRHLELAR